MSSSRRLQNDYPWTSSPLVSCAPMRLFAGPALASAVSIAGGIGFLGAGTDLSPLSADLQTSAQLLSASHLSSYIQVTNQLPIGVGVICHLASLPLLLEALKTHVPAAIWLFASEQPADMGRWAKAIRDATYPAPPKIWVQIGSVSEALEVVKAAQPEVLVVQGVDAGGHGLEKGAGIVSLMPEVMDALDAANEKAEIQSVPAYVATGGIVEGRGAAAALALGADGICMGTRYIAAEECTVAKGYKDEVIRATDGGQTTSRSKVYDTLRGTTHWPERYGGRGVVNESFHDWNRGVSLDENKRLYEEAGKLGDSAWGPKGRMTTYAGTGVGLVQKIQSAKDITEEVREACKSVVNSLSRRL